MGQGNYLEVNDAACQRLGYEREEFLRMSPWDLDLLPEGGSMAELRRALAEEGQVVFESNLRTKSGDRCPAEIHVHRLELGGKPMVLSMLRDLTAEKGLERQLLEARKSEALVRQAGTAAHDFNNILQVINGYGTLIQMGMGEDDPNRHAMEEILRATDRGAQLARSLLEKH
jgi:PAS domain S-box-containing protein